MADMERLADILAAQDTTGVRMLVGTVATDKTSVVVGATTIPIGLWCTAPRHAGRKALVLLQDGISIGVPTDGPAFVSTWQYSDVTTIADPGAGYIRGNAATPGSGVTALAIHNQDSNSQSAARIFEAMVPGDTVYVQERGDATAWTRYSLSGTPTDNTTWWELPVTYSDGGTIEARKNQYLTVSLGYLSGSAA